MFPACPTVVLQDQVLSAQTGRQVLDGNDFPTLGILIQVFFNRKVVQRVDFKFVLDSGIVQCVLLMCFRQECFFLQARDEVPMCLATYFSNR